MCRRDALLFETPLSYAELMRLKSRTTRPPHSVVQIWSSRRLQTRIWLAWAISWWTPSWSSPQSCCSGNTS